MEIREKKEKCMGFSLLELLIYIAIFGVIILMSANFLISVVGGRDGANSRFEVLQNLRFASEKIRQMIYDSSSFQVSGACPLNSLEIFSGGATSTVFVENGVLKVSSPSGQEALTSARVSASTTADCLFKKISNPLPAKPALQLRLEISYNNNGNPKLNFSDEVKTAMSQR